MADVSVPPADAQSSVRPGRYPQPPVVRCGRWIMHRMNIPQPVEGCRPWVGFVGPHNRDETRQLVGASACGLAMVVDPTQATQRPGISFVPEGSAFVRGGLSIIGGVSYQFETAFLLASHIQLGNGLQPVFYSTQTSILEVRNAMGANSLSSLRLPDPRTHFVAALRSLVPASPSGDAYVYVVEIPEPQMDGTFRVRRFLRGGVLTDSSRELASIVRSVGTPQLEGVTSRAIEGFPTPAITCAAADGKLTIELTGRPLSNAYAQMPMLDTGDPTIQRCSLSNANGTILLVASSETRSIAYTVNFRPVGALTTADYVRFEQQPNFLPVDPTQLGRDLGPFDVTLIPTLSNAPAALVLYTRRASAGAPDVPTFAFVDRQFDFESTPETPPFYPAQNPPVGAMYAGAAWGNGQVAFARFDPALGVLDAVAGQCDR